MNYAASRTTPSRSTLEGDLAYAYALGVMDTMRLTEAHVEGLLASAQLWSGLIRNAFGMTERHECENENEGLDQILEPWATWVIEHIDFHAGDRCKMLRHRIFAQELQAAEDAKAKLQAEEASK